tara:strand:- start:26 stop:634 length:609 start_codon:yes stop_codon:yes gene_type:complete
MIKRFIIRGVSKKFKGVQKLKAQKAPTKFTAVASDKATQSAQRKVLGDVPEFMGLSSRATGELAAESLALKTMNKKFFRTLPKELSRSRLRTATGIKGRKLKVKTPTAPSLKQKQAGIFKGSGLPASKPALKLAKSKGALKSYKAATTKSENVFRSTMEKFTGKTKASSFAKRSKKVKKATTALHDSREIQHIKKVKKEWGF